jgi:hypothetical protein
MNTATIEPHAQTAVRADAGATADRQEPSEALAAKVTRLSEKLMKLKEELGKLTLYEKQMLASPDQQISLVDPTANRWPRVVAAPAWLASMFRSRSIPTIN